MAELLLFAILKSANLEIKKIPPKVNVKTPDFKVAINDSQPILIECSLASNALESAEEHARKSSIIQMLEDLTDFPYHIAIDFEKISDQSLSKREFMVFLQQMISNNDKTLPDSTTSKPFTYEGQDWVLELKFFRKNNLADRTYFGSSGPGQTVDNFKSLFTALNDKKPGRYKVESVPYLICLGIDDLSANETEFSEVFFGQNFSDSLKLNSLHNGFFLREGNPRNTSVSGIIFAKSMKLFGLSSTSISLWRNPFATSPIPSGILPFAEYNFDFDGNRLTRKKVGTARDIFELLEVKEQEYLSWLQLENKSKPRDAMS